MKVLQRTGTESAENTRIKKEQKVDEMQRKIKKMECDTTKKKAAILETACQNEKEKDVDNVSSLLAKSYNQDDDTETATSKILQPR